MGWGRTLLLGDIGNRLDIADTEREIAEMKSKINQGLRRDISHGRAVEVLLSENAELKLYLAALIRLLTSKGTISESELRMMVRAVDAEDGKSDGKLEGELL